MCSEYFEELKEFKPDALIISDPGVFDDRERDLSRRLMCISAHRPTIRITALTISGTGLGAKTCGISQRVIFEGDQGYSVSISRMIWRLRLLSMVLCAFPIPADACSAIILPDEMPTRVPVPILAAGNTRW